MGMKEYNKEQAEKERERERTNEEQARQLT